MKASTLFVVASALVGALASPIRPRKVKILTVYEDVVHVVTATSTVWVKASPSPAPPTDNQKGDNYGSYKSPILKEDTPTAPKDYPAPPKAEPSPPKSTPTPEPKPTPELTSTYTPPKELTQKEDMSPPYVSPQPTTPTPEPTTSSTSYKAPEPTPVIDSSAGSGSSNTYASSSDSPSGPADATFYNTGVGSCGVTSTDDQYVVAISHVLMDAKSTGNPNNNPYCGRKIKCTRGEKSVIVTVQDRCPVCVSSLNHPWETILTLV
ncbi:hypothetical protein BDD12DRAFT_135645 [Trichophaea hybrida]|nr:hypothetical protein BDD12DRAFT_135645 [Trichophaea hybrida]